MARSHSWICPMSIDLVNTSWPPSEQFDLLIFAVGYEERSRYIAENVCDKADIKLGYIFPDGHIHSFEENYKFLHQIGGHELQAGCSIKARLEEIGVENGRRFLKICFDVSSFNRGAMAAIMSELLDSSYFENAEISIFYSMAQYRPPLEEEYDFLDFGPLEGFGGWTSHPERPTVLVLGLGYESDHSVGAVEFLDPSATFAFFPIGSDPRFAEMVKAANLSFLELVDEDRVIEYSVVSPYHVFWQMRSLLLSLMDVSRVVLVPMGPKIFCSLCLVCQRLFGDEISVWRASGHSVDSARDAQAAGEVVGYLIRRGMSNLEIRRERRA